MVYPDNFLLLSYPARCNVKFPACNHRDTVYARWERRIMKVYLRESSIESYRLFLKIKALPRYSIRRNVAWFPDEYAPRLGLQPVLGPDADYTPSPFLFDYQRDITRMALRKRRFAVFAQPGLGKTLVMLDYARHVLGVLPPEKGILIVSPLMVIRQTIAECKRFYGDALPIQQVRAKDLPEWLRSGESRLAITNYEAIVEGLPTDRIGALLIDESSSLKNFSAAWATRLIDMGKGVEWKLALTGTPAPNDRIEYANHAVFLDQFPTVNSFLARYFINRGQTQNRWELKPHALKSFYRALSHWCVFLSDPSVYGWKDNVNTLPPIHVHIHDVPLTEEQHQVALKHSNDMFGTPGGIASRSKLSQIAKGRVDGKDVPTLKPQFIKNLIESWPEESTIIWCNFNYEQDSLEKLFPGCASIQGKTSEEDRCQLLEDFQVGRRRILISKPDILGFGLNLQIATRQVFSTLLDSFESYTQAVKRSNRIGSTKPLNVHLPVTEIEKAMVDTVLRKAHMVEQDTREQELLFKEQGINF